MNAWPSLATVLLVAAACGAACGSATKNVDDCQSKLKVHPCAKRTAVEDAQIALDAQNFDAAIADLVEVVSADAPGDYEHYPMLAGAYMGRAGLDLATLVQKSLGSSGSSGGSFLTQLSSIVPSPDAPGRAFTDRIADMSSACAEIDAITAAWLKAPTGGVDSTSVALQKTLYHAAYAAMIVNQVTGGNVAAQSPAQLAANLAKMTPTQAAAFLGSLVAAGNLPPEVTGNAQVSAKVQSTLKTVQNPDGTVNTAQLAALLANNPGATSTSTSTSTSTGTGTGG